MRSIIAFNQNILISLHRQWCFTIDMEFISFIWIDIKHQMIKSNDVRLFKAHGYTFELLWAFKIEFTDKLVGKFLANSVKFINWIKYIRFYWKR